MYQPSGRVNSARASAAPGGRPDQVESDPPSFGLYAREWRATSSDLTRALGRPIRDQATSVRATQATTPQALELVNGEILTRRLLHGARRMLGTVPPEPSSMFNKAVAGRIPVTRSFDIDVSKVSKLWLVVNDTGSNAPERVEPVWAQAEFEGPRGLTPLSSLEPLDGAGLRSDPKPITLNGMTVTDLPPRACEFILSWLPPSGGSCSRA